jgi:MerR family transcriptional regulator, light-induced transcriptional regulator
MDNFLTGSPCPAIIWAVKRRPELLHPIQVAVRRTGLSPDVIRVWERRYGAVRPVRSGSNRRLYSEAEVERLQLLARATEQGRHIGQVAGLDTAHLRALVAADEPARRPRPPATPRGESSPRTLLSAALSAVRGLDGSALDEVLGRAAVALPRGAVLEEVVGPLMQRIGELWREGQLRVVHEHLASAVVRNCLAQMAARPAAGAPVLVAATPAGQRHEFGALLAALEAEAAGFEVAYLGPDLPAEEIAAAAAELNARVVALSLVFPADDPRLAGDLARLRRLVGERTTVLVGGAAAPAYAHELEGAGIELMPSLTALRGRLHALRTPLVPAAPA